MSRSRNRCYTFAEYMYSIPCPTLDNRPYLNQFCRRFDVVAAARADSIGYWAGPFTVLLSIFQLLLLQDSHSLLCVTYLRLLLCDSYIISGCFPGRKLGGAISPSYGRNRRSPANHGGRLAANEPHFYPSCSSATPTPMHTPLGNTCRRNDEINASSRYSANYVGFNHERMCNICLLGDMP